MSKKFDLQAYKANAEKRRNEPNYGVVYILKNTINGKEYVGQTTQDIKQRMKAHKNKNNSKSSIITRAINKYGWDNFEYVVIGWSKSKEDLNRQESEIIIILDTKTPNGYNIMPGGNSFKMPEYVKAKMRGRTPWNKGKKLGVNKALAKPIIGIDKEGDKMYFESAGQAERHILYCNAKHINACCNDKRNTNGGFTWRFATQEEINYYEQK